MMLGLHRETNTGWRTSITAFIASAIIVFILNLVALLWSVRHGTSTAQRGAVVLREANSSGQCQSIKTTDTWLHLLINIFSTIILAGSNYCMQCLCAPSRGDIDKQHPKGKYLDIGLPSTHNLKYLSNARRWTWFGLLFTSLPLHLLYNSAVYVTTSANSYLVFSANDQFLEVRNASIFSYEDNSNIVRSGGGPGAWNTQPNVVLEVASDLVRRINNSTLIKLEPTECIQAYVGTFQSSYRNVLLVTNNKTNTIKYLEAHFYRDYECSNEEASTWVCAYVSRILGGPLSDCTEPCDLPSMQSALTTVVSNNSWAPLYDPVNYCLAEPSEAVCALEINIAIIVVVLVFGAIKIALMLFTLFFALPKSSRPLLCLGDAVSSFLDTPDHISSEKCLLSKHLYQLLRVPIVIDRKVLPPTTILGPVPRAYVPKRHHWSSAVSVRRWVLCVLIYIIGVGVAAAYLVEGIQNITGPKNFQSLRNMGFGSLNAQAVAVTSSDASGNAAVISNVLIANIAQLILSLLYFTYNGLFTGMLLAREWDGYAVRRQGLRVNSTTRSGHQRSSYFLQLPYRWSLPLMVISLILHWLVSQSVFVVNIQMTDYFGLPMVTAPNRIGHLVTIGYSPIAIIIFIIVAGALIIAVLVAGRIPLRSAMPVAGSNSMVIAAACHPYLPGSTPITTEDDSGLSLSTRRLQWGVTGSINPSHAHQIRSIALKDNKPGRSGFLAPSRTGNLQEIQMNFLSSTGELDYRPDVRNTTASKSYQRVQVSTSSSIAEPPAPVNTTNRAEEEQGLLQSLDGRIDSQKLYHCSFSDKGVSPLIEGREYA